MTDTNPGNPNQPTNGKGRYTRTIDSAERDGRAARLAASRNPRYTYQQIADELGYSDRGEAWRGVQRAIRAAAADGAMELIRVESAELDALYVAALEVLERDHYAHSNGQVVSLEGVPLLDDGPKLAAIKELRAIRESYRKLHGLDAAQKVNVSGAVRYEVVGVDPEDLT